MLLLLLEKMQLLEIPKKVKRIFKITNSAKNCFYACATNRKRNKNCEISFCKAIKAPPYNIVKREKNFPKFFVTGKFVRWQNVAC